ITFVSTTMASNAIGSGTSQLVPFIEHIKNRLLPKWDLPYSKFHNERVFIWFFNDAVSESIEYFDCTSDDLKDLIFVQELVVIGVHSCGLVVNPNLAVQLRGRGCSGGTRVNRPGQSTLRARRSTTGFPHDIRHAQGRTSQGPSHLFRSGACRPETECKRARRRKPPDQAVRSPPRIHRRAANRKPRRRKRSLGRSPT